MHESFYIKKYVWKIVTNNKQNTQKSRNIQQTTKKKSSINLFSVTQRCAI